MKTTIISLALVVAFFFTNDLAATTGSISDALKNVPSVEVDVQGNVSLRGDTNVTILVDGKPSALFRGQSAAQALQSLPADSVERVEVITNPSAEFSPEGSAGILNLVMKKTRRAGQSGSIRYNTGTAGRRNGGVSGAYNSNRLTISGDAGFRHEPQHSVNTDQREFFDASGARLKTTHQISDNRGRVDQWNARTGFDFDATAKDRFSAEAHANQSDLDLHNRLNLRGFDTSGAQSEIFDQAGHYKQVRDNRGGRMSWRRTNAFEDDVSVSASHETTYERNENVFAGTISLPVSSNNFQDIRSHKSLTLTDLRADLRRPMPGEARLKAGYDLRIDDNAYDNVALRGVSAASTPPDPTQTNLFLYRQTINAAYLTYEQPIGEFTLLGGLRIEDVQLDLNQVTSRILSDRNRFNAYPTLHLAYRLSDDQQLTLNYSRRISRPSPSDLNPFRVEQDAFNFRAGNPNLKPEQTDSIEAGYQYRAGGTLYVATAYYRQSSHDVTDVVTDLGNGVLLDTKENLNSSKHAGIELVANGHLTKTISYNASTNIFFAEIDSNIGSLPGVIGLAGSRSAIEGGGRFSLNWQATPIDSFQASSQMNARRMTPQGYVEPSFLSFLGYRHKFTDKLSGVLTVQDVFDSFRSHSVIDTPQLHDVTIGAGRIRAAYVGLSWSFGALPKRQPAQPPEGAEPEATHGG